MVTAMQLGLSELDKAMRKAVNAVYCFAQALERYGNTGPLASDFTHKEIGTKPTDAKYGAQPNLQNRVPVLG